MNDRIETIDRNNKTPFNRWNTVNRAIHNFEDNAKLKRNGQEVTLQNYLNEARKDCTIYDVLETYRGDLKLTAEKMNTLHHKVAQDLEGVKDLRDALEVMKKAEASWRELPLEVRKEFGNNVSEFQKNGLSWAKEKIKAYNKAKQPKIEEVKNNE